MFKSEKPFSLWWLVAAAVALVALLYSTRPTYELQTETPKAFSQAIPIEVQHKQKLAEQYWQSVLVLQWKFDHGVQLPANIPDDFSVADAKVLSGAQHELVRTALWNSLRGMWFDTSIWKKSYNLDFSWVTDGVQSVANSFIRLGESLHP